MFMSPGIGFHCEGKSLPVLPGLNRPFKEAYFDICIKLLLPKTN